MAQTVIKYFVKGTSTHKTEIHFKLDTQTGIASDFQIYEGMTDLDGMFISKRLTKTVVSNIHQIRESVDGITLYLKEKHEIQNPHLKF